jgi:hypothetical protein
MAGKDLDFMLGRAAEDDKVTVQAETPWVCMVGVGLLLECMGLSRKCTKKTSLGGELYVKVCALGGVSPLIG